MKHDNEQLRRATLGLSIQPARRNRLREFKGSGQCVEYQSAAKTVRGMVLAFIIGATIWAIIAGLAIYIKP